MPMNRRDAWGCAVAILMLCGYARADMLYDEGKTHWYAAQYPDAYQKLLTYREEPYGRTAQVDYMLGTSGCRLSNRRDWGARVLRLMLYNYPLVEQSRQLVRRELDLCLNGPATLGSLAQTSLTAIDGFISAGASGNGKLYYYTDPQKNPVSTYPARHKRNIPRETLLARTTPLGDGDTALSKIKKLAPGFQVAAVGRFIVASNSGHSPESMRKIAAQLDRYLDFLVRTYRVALPDRYVTIYLVPTVQQLRGLADQLHGLDVNAATIGYTYRDDLSVVAVISGEQIGTLFHEFFHLAVRNNFGDIPQWLDEGIASLYEVSAFYGDTVLGEPNWRGRVLRDFWSIRPTLAQVITSEWFPFDVFEITHDTDGFKDSSRRLAAHMATGRYFILYLQEHGVLARIYRQYQSRDVDVVGDDVNGTAVKLVENALGKPIAVVQSDFEAWFVTVEKDGIKRSSTSGQIIGKELPPSSVVDPPNTTH